VVLQLCKLPQSYAIIAETRQTYRAVLSEPKVVFPANSDLDESSNPSENFEMQDFVAADRPQAQKRQREESRPSKKKKRRQNQEVIEAVI
jgi:ribonuclease P/MRP protein subunit RPP1